MTRVSQFATATALLISISAPLSALALSYLPGQTLNPNCLPSDPTCVVIPNTTSGSFTATSSSATSTFAGNVQVAGNIGISGLSGILKEVVGVITSALVNLASDVTGVLGISNGGTGTSTAPTLGQILVGNGAGGYTLTSTSSLGITSGSGTVSTGTQGQFAFYNAAGTTVTATSSIFLSPAGNVGIGTTSPSATFAVNGSGYFSGNFTSAGTLMATILRTPSGQSVSASDATYNIVAWGDSLTYGDGGGGTTYPIVLSSDLGGRSVYNEGVDAYTSTQIAANMLASRFTDNWTTVIWAGRNDFSSPSTVESNISNMVAALGVNRHYVILSILTAQGEGSGTANYSAIVAINNYLSAAYPNNYLDIREYLVQHGLSDAGLTPTTQDSLDTASDNIPTQLRSDSIHLTATGYTVVAGAVANFISSKLDTMADSNQVLTTGSVPYIFSNPLSFSGPVDTNNFFSLSHIPVLQASSTSTYVGLSAGNWFNPAASSSTGGGNTAVGYQTLFANTTGSSNIAVGQQTLFRNSSGSNNIGIGGSTLLFATSSSNQIAIGGQALFQSTASNNIAIGQQTMFINTLGNSNVAIGANAMYSNTSGNTNVAIGSSALGSNQNGSSNTSVGATSLYQNNGATSTTALGYRAGFGQSGYHNQGSTYVGFQSGYNALTGSDFNVFLGYQAGTDVTTGYGNIFIGPEINTGGNHVTTGGGNICIGYNCILPGGTSATNQLNIGNFIFGTNFTATSTATSIPALLTGRLGIGTSSPYSSLEVWGPDTASTSAFAVVNGASTTEFTVFDTGNAALAGSLTQNSDQRLKTNIRSLDASSSLALINQLNPVTFNWLDPNKGSTLQLGFIAQQVANVFPNLVSTTSATALTPDGTLSLNYIDLISPIVSAIQALDREITSLAATVADFADSFTSHRGTFTDQLCVGTTCVTPAQFQAMVSAANQSGTSQSNGSSAANGAAPVISINGANPSLIQVGAVYNDLGATITGPQADLNLDIATYVNGVAQSPVAIDTSATATDTIDYVVTDPNGLTSTSTRTVIIQAPATSDAASTTP